MDQSYNQLSDVKQVKQTAGLNYFFAALALLSTTIGGGISQLAYYFYQTGFTFSLIVNVLVAIQTALSCQLYLQIREYTVGLESVAEMGYVLIGRPAIFAFNGVIILLCLGAMIIYFNLFGQVSSDIVRTMSHKDIDNDSFYLDTKFYVLLAAVGLLYPAIKRSVEELKIVSIGLFTCIVFITFTTIIMLGEDGTSNNPDEDLAEYWYLNFDRSTVTTLAAFIFSYSCQVNIFQTFNSIKIKTKSYAMKAVNIQLFIAFFVYTSLAFSAVYLFGSSLKPNFLRNLAANPTAYTYIIQFSYIFLIACHIPYVFFAFKECTLTIVDEAHRKTISQALDITIQQARIQQQYQASTTQDPKESGAMIDEKLNGTQVLQQRMQFIDMNPYIYYGVVGTIYVVCVCAGLYISNLGIVFELSSAFILSFLSFFWPAWLYLLAEKKYGSFEDRDQRLIHRIHAKAQIILGCLVTFIMIYIQF